MRLSSSFYIDEKWKKIMPPREHKCTVLHCIYESSETVRARVWKKRTFLNEENGTQRKLMNYFNICLWPIWSYYEKNSCHFTLIFEGLSDNCKTFRLVEDFKPVYALYGLEISGGLFTDNIERNKIDVYRVRVLSL